MKTFHRPLFDYLKKEIQQQNGLISFSSFMDIALYHPSLGYYMRDEITIGEKGDFTTAPEISSLFTKCFARQCQQIIQVLNGGDILEIGAGTGKFAKDLLLELESLNALPKRYLIYEISPRLRQKQNAYFKKYYPTLYSRIIWVEQFEENFKGVIIANEVLDALPHHRFIVYEKNKIKEKCVTCVNDSLKWTISSPLTIELEQAAGNLCELYHLPAGYESEINLLMPEFIRSLTDFLSQGVLMLIDYGYSQSMYYHPERNRGTLTCFYQHQRHDDPLIHLGLQDITAHVDFTRVIETGSQNGCQLGGFTSQAAFLLACGLMDLAQEEIIHLSDSNAFNLQQAIKQLILPMEMGECVKVMSLIKNFKEPLLGFSIQDRSREL